MRIGYLMNTYPVTSATFIRREIAALEEAGVSVTRFAVRRWDQALVDPADQREATKCHYLLERGGLRLALGGIREALVNPRGMVRAIAGVWRLWRNAGPGALVRHLAYLLEAVELKAQSAGLSHIHAHFSTNTAAVALLAARLGGPGYSFTAHGPDEFVDPVASSLALKIAEARFGVAITHFARAQLALAGGMAHWGKLHVVGCGVDLDALTPAPLPEACAPFLCIGRLCSQKAQHLLVDAFAELRATHPQARLVLIGDGETRPAIEAAIRAQSLEAQITLRGWADNASVSAALAEARALVLPSFAEGLPIVIMEAFARGRPVISTYIAGIPELVDAHCGWLIPAGDVAGLSVAMRECLDATPERLAQMGAQGRARVAATHDLVQSAAALKALFARVL
ncbi:MAG: colanic acid biosynthesis glycosyltransferase WcaL [Rhodobacteraceae bacterium]|nr:MAG: colanic acid biosynthesis glycosyltransferase WcaL [Paracoccaceae bacterium]